MSASVGQGGARGGIGGLLTFPKFQWKVARRIGLYLLRDERFIEGTKKKHKKKRKEQRVKADDRGKDLVRWMCEEMRARKVEYGGKEEKRVLWSMYKRFTTGEPLAYIMGNVPFGPLLRHEVRAPILIPRPETEEWTDRLASMLIAADTSTAATVTGSRDSPILNKVAGKEPLKILDLCTGSGCIALSLFVQLQRRQSRPFEIVGLDNSRIAVELAQLNAEKIVFSSSLSDTKTSVNSVSSSVSLADSRGRSVTSTPSLAPSSPALALASGKVNFEQADFFQFDPLTVGGPFDIVVCNPPYIPLYEWKELDDSVRMWEDKAALLGPGVAGLGFYEKLATLVKGGALLRATPSSIHRGGPKTPAMVVEVGHDQAKSVKRIFEEEEVDLDIEIWTDAFRVDRALFMYRR